MTWEPLPFDNEVRSLVTEDVAVDVNGDTVVDMQLNIDDDDDTHMTNPDGSPVAQSFDSYFTALMGMFSESASVVKTRNEVRGLSMVSSHVVGDYLARHPSITMESVGIQQYTQRLSPVGLKDFKLRIESFAVEAEAQLLVSVRDFVANALPRFRDIAEKCRKDALTNPHDHIRGSTVEAILTDRDFYLKAEDNTNGGVASVLDMTPTVYWDYLPHCGSVDYPAKTALEKTLEVIATGNTFMDAVASEEVVGVGSSRTIAPSTVRTLLQAFASGTYTQVLDAALNQMAPAKEMMDRLESFAAGSEGNSFDAAFTAMVDDDLDKYRSAMRGCDIVEASFALHAKFAEFVRNYSYVKN